MSDRRASPEREIDFVTDDRDNIDVVDSNIDIESAEERPGVGYEILGIGIIK